MTRTAAQPGLYDVSSDTPILCGAKCSHCGRVYFPPLGIGCEICGAAGDQLLPTPLRAAGVAFAVAEVSLSPGRTRAPFTVVEVALDEGPLIRSIVHPQSPTVGIGDRVIARWSVLERDADGRDVVEPAFEIAAPTTGIGE